MPTPKNVDEADASDDFRVDSALNSGRRAASTRNTGKMSGRRWILSMTTSPLRSARANLASEGRARSAGSSKSNRSPEGLVRFRISKARVVFPTCRAPRIATMGNCRSRRRTAARCRSRGIMASDHIGKVGGCLREFTQCRSSSCWVCWRVDPPGSTRRKQPRKALPFRLPPARSPSDRRIVPTSGKG